MAKHSLKWRRAEPILKPDNIMSSKAREKGDLTGFKAKYEEDKKINMNFIMTNEYMRLWFEERDFYKKENYIKVENSGKEANVRRRYVQRMNMNNKRPTKNLPIVKLRKFQNIPSKVDDKRKPGEVNPICSKYLKSLEDKSVHRYKPECEIDGKTAKDGNKTEKQAKKPKQSDEIDHKLTLD